MVLNYFILVTFWIDLWRIREMLIRMFVREKRIGAYSYLYLVETVREDGRTKQRIIRNLGRKEAVEAAAISTGWRARPPAWRSAR